MTSLSVPTTSTLPPSQLVPSTNPSVNKLLSRLSRPSLLTLALDWLDERNQINTAPYLLEADDEDSDDAQDLYPPHSNLESLRELYAAFPQKGSKRDVLDRILEGDWRHGLTLYQLAMADMQYLYDHPTSQKWTALKIVRLSSEMQDEDEKIDSIPRFHPSTFLQNLQTEVLPDVKAHYNLDRHTTLPMLLLRIYILDSPYNTSLALTSTSTKSSLTFDSSKTFYIAFPDASPYIYVSLTSSTGTSGGTDTKSLRKLTLDGIPKAFSRPRERYKLEGTGFSTKNLAALCERRGGGRENASGGGWGVYAEENKKDTPLNPFIPTPDKKITREDAKEESNKDVPKKMKRARDDDCEEMVTRRKRIAQARFGKSAMADDGKGIERLDVRLEDTFPSVVSIAPDNEPAIPRGQRKQKGRRSTIETELDRLHDKDGEGARDGEGQSVWKPDVRVTFHGSHVFAGWMTGEEGATLGVVRDGRIKGYK
ncbi:chromosome loss-related protein [Clarireedia jacksonii]